jgi:hypothetical protein
MNTTAPTVLTTHHTPVETAFHFGVSNSLSCERREGFVTRVLRFLLFAGKDMRGFALPLARVRRLS